MGYNEKLKQKYHAVGTVLKHNIKIVERFKIDTPYTQNMTSLLFFGLEQVFQ